MGWLSAIGSFLTGGSKSGSDNVMKVASGIGGWIDGQQFTDQEKSEFNGKVLEQYGKFMETTIGENTQRSLTRRDLAMWIIRAEILLLVFSVALFKIDKPWGDYVYKICTDSPLALLTLGVGAFFFGTHLVRAAQGK